MSLVRTAVLVSMSEYVALGAGMVQAMLLSRALGPDGIGQYALLLQTALFATQFASLGLPTASVYAINAEKRDPSVVAMTSVWITLIMSAVSVAAVLGVFSIFRGFFGHVSALAIAGMVIYVPALLVRQSLNQLSVAVLDARAIATVRGIPEVLLLLAVAILFFFARDRLDVPSAFFLFGLMPAAGMILAWIAVRKAVRLRDRPDLSYLWKILPLGLQIAAADALVVLNGYVILAILRYFSADFADVGYFSRAYTLAMLVVTAGTGVYRLLYSRWSTLKGEDLRRHTEITVSLGVFGCAIACIVVCAAAHWLVLFLFGRAFLPSVMLSRLLIIGVPATILARMLQMLFLSDARQMYNLLTLAIGLAFNAAAGLLLVPAYGAVGAAVAMTTGCLCMGVATGFIAVRQYGLAPARMLVPSVATLGIVMRSLSGRPKPDSPREQDLALWPLDGSRKAP